MVERRRPGRAMGAMALAGAVGGLGHPPFDAWYLTIAAFAVAFVMFERMRAQPGAFWLGLAFGTGYFAVSVHWIVEPFFVDPVRHGWMAPFGLLFMSAGLALFWAVAFWGARAVGKGSGTLIVTLTLAELARAYFLTGFPWGMPSYVLVNHPVVQAAAIVGPYALSAGLFVLAWFIARAVREDGYMRWAWALLGLVAVLLPMAVKPQSDGPATKTQIVRLVQPNAPQRLKWHPDHIGRFFDRAVDATAAPAARRPDLIVWPESSVPKILSRAQGALAVVAGAAQGAQVVLGINRFDGERAYNAAIVLDGQGQVAEVYDKHHLVPFGEYVPLGDLLARFGITGFAARFGNGFSAGPGPALVDLGPLGKALPLICYEAVFPHDVRGTQERPDLLLQITNDAWFGSFSGPYQHLAQARMRAIETGLPLLRAANTGVSAVIDARGRVTASLPLNTDGYLDAVLPGARAPTPYTRTGDLPLVVLLIVLTAGLALRARLKSD